MKNLFPLLFISLAFVTHSPSYGEPKKAGSFKIPKEYSELIPFDYRKHFSRVTEYEYSGLHWRQWIVIYMNTGLERYKNNYDSYVAIYLEDEDEEEKKSVSTFEPYEEGTIFLKEHYAPKEGGPGQAASIAIMIKRDPGWDEVYGDWEYAQWDVDGNILMAGNSRGEPIRSACYNCHSHMEDRDFIFSTFFLKEASLEAFKQRQPTSPEASRATVPVK